jgi:hypothetical protein
MDRTAIIKALRDTAQSASNAVATNVSGPVDLLAAGLRKLGVPVPRNALGGSQWMADQGLTREVAMGAPRIIGETLGMAGPAVLAGKAPQIAGAMNRGMDNLAAPRTLNNQAGAIVWHGSPHKFDKFDASKIGTGEGAQAYGHGLYLAESPDVAQGYKTALSPYELVKDGKQIPYDQMDTIAAGVASDIASKKGDVKAVRAMYESMANQKFGGDVAKQRLAALDSMGANVAAEKGGSLYKVDLPDEHIAKMLDWDKPLGEQRSVMDALYDSPVGRGGYANGAMGERRFIQPLKSNRTGAAMLEDLRALYGPTKAEQVLKDAGIPGIRYLDGGSRGKSGGELIDVFQSPKGWQSKIRKDGSKVSGQIGDHFPQASQFTTSMPFKSEQEARQWAQQQIQGGTSNFVVFPGNEGLLSILERNGQPLGMMGIK